jgi:hypothetical protein
VEPKKKLTKEELVRLVKQKEEEYIRKALKKQLRKKKKFVTKKNDPKTVGFLKKEEEIA